MISFRRKQQSATRDFEKFLKDNNCTYTIDKDDTSTTIPFEFQAGQFIASIRKQDDCVEVTYPCMATAPMSQLELVRSRCNERNNANILFKFTYSLDHEENEVNVHLSFFNNVVNGEELKHELSAAFHFQREWVKAFDEDVATSKEHLTSDLESEVFKHNRELFMLRRQEMRHQFNSPDRSVASIHARPNSLPLWEMLEHIHPLPQSTLLFMTENTASGQRRIEDEKEIRNYDLAFSLVEGDGKDMKRIRDYAVLDLHYKQGKDEQPRMMTISITAEGDDGTTLYSRVTITAVPRNASRMNSMSKDGRQPHSVSVLIALDRYDDTRRRQECDYMWTDAQIKLHKGEQDSMTEDQIMLAQVEMADVAYNLYWGQQMFLAERYYEAMLYLENVFNSYRANFFDMTAEHKRTFMEVAYKLGFIYNELELNKQAFYYLDLMANDGNIRHTMELVNAMANGKDLRLFSFTESVMDEVKRNFSEDEELPENIKDFINFLRRRRGYAFIDFNQLDKAEKIFTQMLDEEDNADYAINELAYIKKLRQMQDEDSAEEPEVNPNDVAGPKGQDDQPAI